MIKPKHVYNNYHQDNLYLLEVMPDLSLYSIWWFKLVYTFKFDTWYIVLRQVKR